MRILLATEEITNRPREGTLVFLMHLAWFLRREGDLTILHEVGETDPDLRAIRCLSPKIVLSRRLLRLLGRERFDVLLYVPRSGLSAAGIARGALLGFLSKSPVIVIGLHERQVDGLNRMLAPFGRPDLVLSPVRQLREGLEQIGMETGFIMPGYDDRLFRPVGPEVRERLKAKYDLPRGKFILLHVGHVREDRNVEALLRYRDWGVDVQPVVKAGAVDPSWVDRLRRAGIIVIDEYLRDVHELYQASDAYLFPVAAPAAAVEFPLSVIEACACNLPVLTTPFGILAEMIREGDGVAFYTRASEIPAAIASLRRTRPDTAAKVRNFSWDAVFRSYLLPRMASLAAEAGDRNKH